MNWFPLFLAWRYMWATGRQHTISTMVRVSCLALAIGACALALTMSVMRGFEQSTHRLLQSIHAPLIMSAGGNALDYEAIKKVLSKEFPEISASSPSDTQHAIIKDPISGELSAPVMLKGILPKAEAATTQLVDFIQKTESSTAFPPLPLKKNQVMIGQRLAKQLQLKVGDTIELVYAPEKTGTGNKMYLSTTPAEISGIFKTGLEEIDAGMIYASLSFVQQLFTDAQVSSIALRPNDTADHTQLKCALRKRFGLDVYAWQELYPALVSALQLESYAMFFILSLIILVASMSILAVLYMQIQHKRGDIAILYTLGCSPSMITQIFMYMGIIIACVSCLIGLTLATGSAYLIDHYQLIRLPDSYLISHLPVSLEPTLFIGIFIFVLGVSIIATWIPCRSLRRIPVSTLLRQLN